MAKKKSFEELYGLRGNPFKTNKVGNFGKQSKLMVKDELEPGEYQIFFREPEQTTFKADLISLTSSDKKVRQIRVLLNKRDYDEICKKRGGKA